MEQLMSMFCFFTMFSCLMIITSMNPIHSVFWMVLVFMWLSMSLISSNLDFIPFMIMMMYMGAMTMLFLFMIMMVDMIQLKKYKNINHLYPMIFMMFIIIMNMFCINNDFIKNNLNNNKIFFILSDLSNMQTMSNILYSYYGVLMLMSFLLLMGMVGAMILTLDNNIYCKKQFIFMQHKSNNSWIGV